MSKYSEDLELYPGPEIMHYTIEGIPIALARPRFGKDHIYDSQKQLKYSVGIQLKDQHFGYEPFEGPLRLDVVFFMPMPQRIKSKSGEHSAKMPQYCKPDLSNLIKFIEDASNKIIIEDDAMISEINAGKYYSEIPRTELTITRIKRD